MIQQVTHNYAEAIQAIKQAILKSRYNAAVQMLMLYFGVGEYISNNSRTGTWGTNAIETISVQFQKELPELRGFSATNIKNMRLFYETWANRQLATADIISVNNQIIIPFTQKILDSPSKNADFTLVLPTAFTMAPLLLRTIGQCYTVRTLE